MTHSAEIERSANPRTGVFTELVKRWLVLAALVPWIAACSDASVTTTTAFSYLEPAATQTGVFRPGSVAGLSFVAGSNSGVTDAGGRFTCSTGQPIAFSIGNVELGETVCATLAHPAALAASGAFMDLKAINITRFLLLLDADQNAANGIVIPTALRTLASAWPRIDFSASDFESQLTRVYSDIASVEGRATVTLPSSTEAFGYLDPSLSCAYSGLFVNTFPAGAFNAPTDVALIVYREPGSTSDLFHGRIKRNHPQSQMFVESRGIVQLQALPSLIDVDSAGIGSIAADYRTPDVVSGNWSRAFAQQVIDRAGFFEALRIGREAGEHRFVGSYTRIGDASLTIVVGFVSLVLAGDTLVGEAFDVADGYPLTVSGQRAPGSTVVQLTTEFATRAVPVTLLTDENDVPIGLEGTWPDIEGSTFRAVGCRLY